MFNFLRNCKGVFRRGCNITFPPKMYDTSSFSLSSIKLDAVSLFHFTLSRECAVVSHCGFNLHSPDDNGVVCLFMYLLAICVSSLMKHLFIYFVHFVLPWSEIHIIQKHINVNNSMAFSTFSVLYNYHFHLVLKHFHYSKRKFIHMKQLHPISHSTYPLITTIVCCVSVD